MAKDERRAKIEAENRFYLDLKHKHGNQFEAALTPEELATWALFPAIHQRLFMRWRDGQWMVKTSLEKIHSSRRTLASEQAEGMLHSYLITRSDCQPVMRIVDLQYFLYPLLDVPYTQLRDNAVASISHGINDPIQLTNFVDEEDYADIRYSVNIGWLEQQKNECLKECSAVWRYYLNGEQATTPDLSPQQSKREETQKRHLHWHAEVERLYKTGGYKTHKAVSEKIELDEGGGTSAKTIRNVTTATWDALKKRRTE